MGAEPVVDFQDASDEHDERDVEGEAGRAAGPMHAVDLVAIAGDWTRRDAASSVLDRRGLTGCGGVQNGCDVLHNSADEEHDDGRMLGWAVRFGTPVELSESFEMP